MSAARVLPNNRFAYFAYWTGVGTPEDEARLWLLDPDAAAVFPHENGHYVLAIVAHKDRLPEFRADREAAYARMLAEIPEGPDLAGAERVSKLVGQLPMPNKMRPAARPGLAFIGDAALAADPLFGVGCGWAFQSAEWLVDETHPALLGHGDLDAALDRYRRALRRRLGPHHLHMSDYSTGRLTRRSERMAFQAAATDSLVGAAIEEVAARRTTPLRLLDPRLTLRVWRNQPS